MWWGQTKLRIMNTLMSSIGSGLDDCMAADLRHSNAWRLEQGRGECWTTRATHLPAPQIAKNVQRFQRFTDADIPRCPEKNEVQINGQTWRFVPSTPKPLHHKLPDSLEVRLEVRCSAGDPVDSGHRTGTDGDSVDGPLGPPDRDAVRRVR